MNAFELCFALWLSGMSLLFIWFGLKGAPVHVEEASEKRILEYEAALIRREAAEEARREMYGDSESMN